MGERKLTISTKGAESFHFQDITSLPDLRAEFRQLMLAGVRIDINIWISGSATGARNKLISSLRLLGGS